MFPRPRRKIVWNSSHLNINPSTGKLENKDTEDEDDVVTQAEMDEMAELGIDAFAKVTQLTATPFGVYAVNDDMHPMKQFKLWMGHANFTLDKKLLVVIAETPGIEVVLPISRYRFMIGVGECFQHQRTKYLIEQNLDAVNRLPEIVAELFEDEGDRTAILDTANRLNKAHNEWCICVNPADGSISHTSSGVADFEQKYQEFTEIEDAIIITS